MKLVFGGFQTPLKLIKFGLKIYKFSFHRLLFPILISIYYLWIQMTWYFKRGIHDTQQYPIKTIFWSLRTENLYNLYILNAMFKAVNLDCTLTYCVNSTLVIFMPGKSRMFYVQKFNWKYLYSVTSIKMC